VDIAILAKSQKKRPQKNTARAPAPSSAMNSQLPAVLVGSFCGSLTRHVYDSMDGPRPRLPFSSTFSRALANCLLFSYYSLLRSSLLSRSLARLRWLLSLLACLLD